MARRARSREVVQNGRVLVRDREDGVHHRMDRFRVQILLDLHAEVRQPARAVVPRDVPRVVPDRLDRPLGSPLLDLNLAGTADDLDPEEMPDPLHRFCGHSATSARCSGNPRIDEHPVASGHVRGTGVEVVRAHVSERRDLTILDHDGIEAVPGGKALRLAAPFAQIVEFPVFLGNRRAVRRLQAPAECRRRRSRGCRRKNEPWMPFLLWTTATQILVWSGNRADSSLPRTSCSFSSMATTWEPSEVESPLLSLNRSSMRQSHDECR